MLIVYAHPKKKGHCGYFLEIIKESLKEKGIKYEIIDLYESGFDPILKKDEIYINEIKDKQILAFQEKIKKNDKIILIYPNWWQNMPAILKGFLDRTFTAGFAFRYENGKPKPLLKDKKAAVFVSTGASTAYTSFVKGDRVLRIMTDDTLSFCGIKAKGFLIGNASELDDLQKNNIKRIVEKVFVFLEKK